MFSTIDKIGIGIAMVETAIGLIIGGLCLREADRIVNKTKKEG